MRSQVEQHADKLSIQHTPSHAQRTVWMDLLRIFAVICMMTIHVSAGGITATPILTRQWDVLLAFNGAGRCCVPLFIMISGALFLQPERTVTGKYLLKHTLRLVLSLIVWNILYATVYIAGGFLKTGVWSFDMPVLSNGRFGKVLGQYHLVFLYYMTGLYLIMPFLRVICEKRTIRICFFALSILTASILPTLALIPAFAARVTPIIATIGINIAMGMTLYFVGGYVLSTEPLSRTCRCILYAAAFAGLLATGAGTYFRTRSAGILDETFLEYLRPNVVVYSVGVFVFFRYVVSKLRVSEKIARVIATLAKCSFGMYLCHDLVLLVCYKLISPARWPLFTVPLLTVMVFAISFGVSYGLRKIPFVKQYLV